MTTFVQMTCGTCGRRFWTWEGYARHAKLRNRFDGRCMPDGPEVPAALEPPR